MPPVRIKMCGMMRLEDIKHAAILGVDAIGLIFYPDSRRFISVSQAKTLSNALPPFVDAVAVFVNPSATWVWEVLHAMPIQYLQFHGDESPEFCTQFSYPYIKAVPATSSQNILNMMHLHSTAKAILLDTPSMSCRGGGGKVFNWTVIPKHSSKPLILAGGLNALNVKEAVSQSNVYAVDVCSGIESSPGVKDYNKMSLFVNACR